VALARGGWGPLGCCRPVPSSARAIEDFVHSGAYKKTRFTLFGVLSLCLSRACPGKMISFSMKLRKRCVFLPIRSAAAVKRSLSGGGGQSTRSAMFVPSLSWLNDHVLLKVVDLNTTVFLRTCVRGNCLVTNRPYDLNPTFERVHDVSVVVQVGVVAIAARNTHASAFLI
jgi:hypothetical protein